jgi:hypothetical protein
MRVSEARPIPAAILVRLLEWYTADEALEWWTSPQPLLGGRPACDVPYNVTLRLLDQLDSGAYL